MNKEEIVKKYGTTEKDTGSSAVQISLLTQDISKLQKHLGKFKKDFHSRLGLMCKISNRHKLMKVMKIQEPIKYQDLIKDLEIRG